MIRRAPSLVVAIVALVLGCTTRGRPPRADEYVGLPRNAEEIVLARARTFADTARGPAFGLPPVATREMVVERGAGARRRAAAALGVAARGGAAPADLVLVRLGRAGYLAYLPDGFGRAGEFLCLYALLDPGLATFRGLCG